MFLEDYELMLNIPDDCIPLGNTIAQRRNFILLKLAGMNLQADFENIALQFFGIVVIAIPGLDSFNAGDPASIGSADDALHTLVIEFIADSSEQFPYTFPLPFGSDGVNILKCLYAKLIPATDQVLFIEP